LRELKEGGKLGRSLKDQFKALIEEEPPSPYDNSLKCSFKAFPLLRESHGPHWSLAEQGQWAHFNLREQSELLQLNLLYLHSQADDRRASDNFDVFKELLQLYQSHDFGRKLSALKAKCGPDLRVSVGQLECLTLMYLIDLPSLTVKSSDHPLLRSDGREEGAKVDKLVAGLGSAPDHGPVMVTWMMARYLACSYGAATEEDDLEAKMKTLSEYEQLGERALELRCFDYLTRCCRSSSSLGTTPPFAGHPRLLAIVRGVCYSLLAVHLSNFTDPIYEERLSNAGDVHNLMLELLKVSSVANLTPSPYSMRPFFRLSILRPTFGVKAWKLALAAVSSP